MPLVSETRTRGDLQGLRTHRVPESLVGRAFTAADLATANGRISEKTASCFLRGFARLERPLVVPVEGGYRLTAAGARLSRDLAWVMPQEGDDDA